MRCVTRSTTEALLSQRLYCQKAGDMMRVPALPRCVRTVVLLIGFYFPSRLATIYEWEGSSNVIRLPALGGSNGCGTMRLGASKLLMAFKSGPVSIWHSPTRVGAPSRHTTSTSRVLA